MKSLIIILRKPSLATAYLDDNQEKACQYRTIFHFIEFVFV
jgi:hypothetical protein